MEEGTTYSIIAPSKTKNELQQQTEFETILEVSLVGSAWVGPMCTDS